MATAITPEDIAALERMIILGRLEIEYESAGERRRVKYRSMRELKEALSYAKQALAEAGGDKAGFATLAEFDRS